jgi:hypothetical protein
VCLVKNILKAMLTRINSYLEKQNYCFEKQYGFRKRRYTTLALVETLDTIHNQLDGGYI